MRVLFCFFLLIGILPFAHPRANAAEFRIKTDFEGGNLLVDKIDGNDVHIRPDLRDTRRDWFYWNFRVQQAAGKTLTFHFPRKNLMSSQGPAASNDHGQTWQWLGKPTGDGKSFQYNFGTDENNVWFCMSIPYTQRNLTAFLKRHQQNKHLLVKKLCQSRKGRDVKRLHIGCLNKEPKYRVALTARHHCCEMIASYALEGIVDEVLADSQAGQWFRENVEFLIVPIVDYDGVMDGDQGKMRRPHDHNRDYVGKSIYPEVKAIRELVPEWSKGKLKFFLDMHCPALTGRRYNEVIYFVALDHSVNASLQPFTQMLEKRQTTGLPYLAKETVAFGESWNIAANYTDGVPSSHWFAHQKGVRFSSTVEIPYADVKGTAVTRELARDFGANLAKTIQQFLLEY